MTGKSLPELKQEIKELIVETLEIEEVKPEEIKDSASLFEDESGLELDSVDALEVVVALQRRYGVRIDDQNLARAIVKSVDTIAEFIAKKQAEKEL